MRAASASAPLLSPPASRPRLRPACKASAPPLSPPSSRPRRRPVYKAASTPPSPRLPATTVQRRRWRQVPPWSAAGWITTPTRQLLPHLLVSRPQPQPGLPTNRTQVSHPVPFTIQQQLLPVLVRHMLCVCVCALACMYVCACAYVLESLRACIPACAHACKYADMPLCVYACALQKMYCFPRGGQGEGAHCASRQLPRRLTFVFFILLACRDVCKTAWHRHDRKKLVITEQFQSKSNKLRPAYSALRSLPYSRSARIATRTD